MFYPNDPLYLQDLVLEETQEHNMTLPIDDDHDGMADAWEREYGLDLESNDAEEDLDGDGINNLTEYQQQTDPAEESVKSWGCNGSSAMLLFPIVWIARRRRR